MRLLPALLAVILAMFSLSSAVANASEEATLIVYRAEEPRSTERLRLNVRLDGDNLGRLRSDDVVSVSQASGSYTLTTSMGGEPITVDLKPGQTHYVRVDLSARGTSVSVAMSEVAEQVALVEQPELDAAI